MEEQDVIKVIDFIVKGPVNVITESLTVNNKITVLRVTTVAIETQDIPELPNAIRVPSAGRNQT